MKNKTKIAIVSLATALSVGVAIPALINKKGGSLTEKEIHNMYIDRREELFNKRKTGKIKNNEVVEYINILNAEMATMSKVTLRDINKDNFIEKIESKIKKDGKKYIN